MLRKGRKPAQPRGGAPSSRLGMARDGLERSGYRKEMG